jgi:hypothetical protein
MTKYLEFRFFPMIVVVFLVAIYAVTDYSLIQCNFFIKCSSIESVFISQIDEKVVHLSNVRGVLANKITVYETRSNRVKDKEREIEETQANVDDKAREVRETLAADANANVTALTVEKTKLEGVVKTKREEANTLVADREKANTEIAAVRNQVSVRYSSRLLWVFLTAVFFVLCVAAIIVSRSVIKDSIPDEARRKRWLLCTTIGAMAFALAISLPVFLRNNYPSMQNSNYMSIVLPMYEKSFGGNGDLSLDVINFINAFGFAATIFILAASCSIIASVQKKKQVIASESAVEKAEAEALEDAAKTAEKVALTEESLTSGLPVTLKRSTPQPAAEVETYEKQKTNARIILYIGGLMLFVGMLRVKLIGDWHLAFVSSDPNNPYYKLLAEFLKSSLAVQAGFYTIILAAIYLPVVYVIQSRDVPPETKKEEARTGWSGFSLADVLPRLIAIISPFLAGPLLDFLKYFTNK